MLTIRKEQMDELAGVTHRRYVEKTVLHLRNLFSEQAAKQPDSELRALVEEGIVRAKKYHITDGRELTLFINLMIGLDRNFETQPANGWIRQLLEHPELQPDEKMDMIYHRMQAMNRSTSPAKL